MTENIEVLTHSSIRIRSEQGVIYIDPFKMREEPHDAAYVLITHDHHDHFSTEDIKCACNSDTVLVVPKPMYDTAQCLSGDVSKIVEVTVGETCEIDGLKIETVAAYNKMKPFHPKSAGWVGYIIETDGVRIYIAGDTDVTKENKAVRCDVALVPVGGTYTMNAAKAAELVNTIGPAVAIPTHYGSVVGNKKDADTFASKVDDTVKVEIKMQY